MPIATHHPGFVTMKATASVRSLGYFAAGMAWAAVAYIIGVDVACVSLWLLSLVA